MKKTINTILVAFFATAMLFAIPACNKTKVADEKCQKECCANKGEDACKKDCEKACCKAEGHHDEEHACKPDCKKKCCKKDEADKVEADSTTDGTSAHVCDDNCKENGCTAAHSS